MKFTKSRLIAGLAVIAALYLGSYIYFRMDHIFVHLAGANHRIEAAEYFRGKNLHYYTLAKTYHLEKKRQSSPLNQELYDQLYKEKKLEIDQKNSRRRQLFTVFLPVALLETQIWKILD